MRPHRIARINYAIRTIAFAWCFLVVALVFRERGISGWLAWSLLALQFLVYPHLAWLRARFAADSQRAELQNLLVDPALLGAWMASLGFPVWVSYAAVFSTMLNNATIGGWGSAVLAAGAFALGALAWILPAGFTWQPDTSTLVTALCFFGSIAYTCSVGAVVRTQNERLRGAREALRASEHDYRLITEHAADLVAMVDRDARWLYASPSYGRFLAPADLARGADAFARLHEEDLGKARGTMGALLRDGSTHRLRVRLLTSNGDVRRLETLVHPVRDEAGAITGAVLASRDVTELRDREEQLEIAAHAFERMAEGMVISNAAGRILSINRAFSRITGYPSGEVIGRAESEIRSGLQPASFYDDLYAEVLRSGYWSGTSWCKRRDGTLYREWRNVSVVRDAEERVTHFVSLFREMDGRGADVVPVRGGSRVA